MPTPTKDQEAQLAEATRAMLLAMRELGGGPRMLIALVYLADRRHGGRLPFDSNFQGPSSGIVRQELERAVAMGLVELATFADGRTADPIDGSRTRIRVLPAAAREPRFKVSPDALKSARALVKALGSGPRPSTVALVVAAKLGWIRELAPDAVATSLDRLAAELRWASVTPAHLVEGVRLAQALGYR